MSYSLVTMLSNKNNYGAYRAASQIKYLVIHYTANDGDKAMNNAKYFANNVVKASAHYFVDDTTVYQSVPDNYVAWSVGGSKYANCATTGGGTMYKTIQNTNSISIEMCDTNKDGAYNVSDKTLENTFELVKVLMKKYNIDINHVYRHFDVTGKACPAYYTEAAKWNEFKTKLAARLNASVAKQEEVAASTTYTQAQFIADIKTILNMKSATITGLYKVLPTLSAKTNKNHALVTPLERYMKALGYYAGSIEADSGKTPAFGSGLTAAIKKYQTYVVKFTNVKYIDGEVTANGTTWKYLLGIK